MPRGDKSSYTSKQKRQAGDIEDSYERKGVAKVESERRAWATVNKMSGGGLKKEVCIEEGCIQENCCEKIHGEKTAAGEKARAQVGARQITLSDRTDSHQGE